MTFRHRIATQADIPAIVELMGLAIETNMAAFLSAQEVAAARESMGVDQLLIADGTYFVIESVETTAPNDRVMVGCGGWGKRHTLYGGDQTVGRNDTLNDPKTDAARIRAMYTHAEWTRQGIGTLLLELGEQAARDAGYRTIELGSTVPGEPLYLARGYQEVERVTLTAANGAPSTIITMRKAL